MYFFNYKASTVVFIKSYAIFPTICQHRNQICSIILSISYTSQGEKAYIITVPRVSVSSAIRHDIIKGRYDDISLAENPDDT